MSNTPMTDEEKETLMDAYSNFFLAILDAIETEMEDIVEDADTVARESTYEFTVAAQARIGNFLCELGEEIKDVVRGYLNEQ